MDNRLKSLKQQVEHSDYALTVLEILHSYYNMIHDQMEIKNTDIKNISFGILIPTDSNIRPTKSVLLTQIHGIVRQARLAYD